MALLVKICGLSTRETLDAAIEAGADMVGFVFFEPSPRHVDLAKAAELARIARGRVQSVVLTVDADPATIGAIAETVKPDWLQLHGVETPEAIAAMKREHGLPVMKALPVSTRADLAAVSGYEGIADRILFDARAPKDATRPGGLGVPFDWHLLEGLTTSLPLMLSGGLDANNVAEALRVTRLGGVDTSSGVERSPGLKDIDKIFAFVRAARAAETPTLKLASGQ